MTLQADPTIDRLKRRMQDSGFDEWKAKVHSTGGCAHPVHLTGRWAIHDTATGHTLTSTSGEIFAACGNRRESVCPACSDRYAADAFHLLRAGLSGGTKGVSTQVTDRPRVFATLTAPSFGPVHNRPTTSTGKARACACGSFHHEHDSARGQPLDPDSYDYTGHVLWNAHVGPLWHYFRLALLRTIAKTVGIPIRAITRYLRVSYAKVAEYQRRGCIHLHSVIRLDGPDGPDDPPPTWATTELLDTAIRTAVASVRITSPEVDGQTRELAWGSQVDIRPIRAEHVEDDHGVITEDRLSSYVAKYATKGTSTSEAADRPIRSEGHIEHLAVNPHHRRLMRTAWTLGGPNPCGDCHPTGPHVAKDCGCETGHPCTPDGQHCTPECESGHYCHTCHASGWVPGELASLKLRRWTHMLGFRGHFLSKSKHYSTTFKRIRGDRRQYRHEAVLDDLGVTDDEITVINHWDMTRVGYGSPEETDLAQGIALKNRELRKQRHDQERKD